MISFAPYFAYAVEIPSPSPAAAPVISATFPSSLAILSSPLLHSFIFRRFVSSGLTVLQT